MPDLFVPCCSIAPTRRRRFLWAAWWTEPPTAEPFRKPDASSGGARTRDEALAEAERAAGRPLVEVEGRWARAWSRVLIGEPPFMRGAPEGDAALPRPKAKERTATTPRSVWQVLGVPNDASRDEIRSAFRAGALATHPDRGGDPEAFRALRRAYDNALERRAEPRPRRRR